jgi:hypothetical protein
MPDFSFQSELLNADAAASGSLRAVVGCEGVSLWANDAAGETLAVRSWQFSSKEIGFQAIESELRQVLGGEKLLTMPFGTTRCAFSHPQATLVPRRLFSPDALPTYFELLVKSNAEWQYGFEELADLGCVLVWAVEPDLTKICGQYFPSENLRHLAAPLLRAWRAAASASGASIFANLRGQSVQLAVFDRQNLGFYNTFPFLKPSDLLYFVLLAYEQSGLRPLEVPLVVSGPLLEDSEIYRLLHRYVDAVRFSPLPAEVRLPDGEPSLPAHGWFDVLSI